MKNLNIYTFRELIKMYIDERPMPDVAFVTQTEAMKLQSMVKEMNNNSEWITDRKPMHEDDGTMVYGPDGNICHWTWIKNGDAWKPIHKCEPYVKPKRCIVLLHNDGSGLYRVSMKGVGVPAYGIPTYEAAERIAAIYEEVTP